MSGFDYPYTCPRIDKTINSAKKIIESFIDSLLSDAVPLLPTDTREGLAKEHSEALYLDLEECFESVRNENEQMRREANRQIESLEREVSDLQSEIERMEQAA